MKFIDSTQIRVRAGRGGDGIASFKSAKGAPKLGPDGGDGGTGGSIIFQGHNGLNTLSNLRYRAIYRAEDGVRGGTNGATGACGEDLVLRVPLGTVAIDIATGDCVAEIIEHGEEVVVAKGGRHGLGNMHWTSPTHQAPEEYRPGTEGESRELRLELKLIADVGLAGFPNAGKSTLLSRISAARPKIADYPFTTLKPNLGVVELKTGSGDYGYDAIVVADVPGLIEGASIGKGLGHAFLKHLERTCMIAYIVDGNDAARDVETTLATLKNELASFGTELAKKRSIVVINKIDLLDEELVSYLISEVNTLGHEAMAISAVEGAGIDKLKYRLLDLVKEEKARLLIETAVLGKNTSEPRRSGGYYGLAEPESHKSIQALARTQALILEADAHRS